MNHPRDVFSMGRSTSTRWEMERDGTTVRIAWGGDDDAFDPVTQIADVTVTLEYEGPDGAGALTDAAPQRCFTANELRALVAASGRFEIADIFGALDASVPFTSRPEAWRMVPVLRRLR